MEPASPPASEHIVASITDPGAGPSYSVRALTGALASRGASASLHTIAGWRDTGATPTVCPAVRHASHPQDFAGAPGLGALCFSSDLERALKASAAPVLHSHGLWLMANIHPARAARATGASLVVSPRGMLGPEALAFSHLKKRAFWTLFQRRALEGAAMLHATGEGERADIRAAGLKNPVAVIANGVDIPAWGARPEVIGRTALSLGRIHPKKGLPDLVRAWATLDAPGWRLRIVGPAELGHDDELRALAASIGAPGVSIEPPLYGAEKLAAYRAADLFILPTLNDNFAMTVAEALAAGTPVIATHGAPWAGLEREGAGWWVERGPESLGAALARATALPRETLLAMGERGRDWMARDFSWDRIAADMLDAYAWLIEGGAPPPTVRLD